MSQEAFAEAFGPVPQLQHDPNAYTSGHDLASLLCLARGAIGVIEFGTARGQTTLALARACPEARVVTLDVLSPDLVPADAYQRCDLRPHAEVGAAFHGTPEASRITQVWIDPNEPYNIDALAALGPFDFAFIDGLHTHAGVAKDTFAALALVETGIIVWDDFLSAGVPVLLREIELQHPVALIHVAETRLVYARMPLSIFATA